MRRLGMLVAVAAVAGACAGAWAQPATPNKKAAEKEAAARAKAEKAKAKAKKKKGGSDARVFYVREKGRDKNTGTSPEQAFATIGKAVSMCRGSGYTIYVGPGEYEEIVEIGTGSGSTALSGTESEPNQIIADATGDATGDEPGVVVVEGDGKRDYGVRIQGLDHWSVSGLTLRGQEYYGVYAANVRGFEVTGCAIEVPAYYGVFAYATGGELVIEGNELLRDADAGHGMYLYTQSAATIRATENRFALEGGRYLSTGFAKGQMGSSRSRNNSWYTYGIVALGQGNAPVTIELANNVGSDCYIGLYAYAVHAGSTVRVSSNTMSGCLYPVYVYAYNSPAVVSNNIVTDSYYPLYAYSPAGRIAGTLEWRIARPLTPTVGSNTGALKGVDPMFGDARGGDFSLASGSPAIDAGFDAGAPREDILGRARPADGDGDGRAAHDLGAHEAGGVSERARRRIVRWWETARDGGEQDDPASARFDAARAGDQPR